MKEFRLFRIEGLIREKKSEIEARQTSEPTDQAKACIVLQAEVQSGLPDGQRLSLEQIKECWKKADGLNPDEQARRAQIYDEMRPTHYHYS